MATKTSLDLSQFKAPGVYTVEFDNSITTQIQTNTLRLIVGFSRKGVYNRPVLISNRKELTSVYGEIDTFLEQRGSFFHRSIQAALNSGPVLALALLPTNNGQDQTIPRDEVEFKGFSVAFSEKNAKTGKDLYSSFYDKEMFWRADEDNFKAIMANNPSSIGKLLGITNLGQKPVSVLIKKYREPGFDITAREFYGAGNVPAFLQEFDYLSDYFVEVIVVEGDWEDAHKFVNDPTYSTFFNSNGVKKEKLESFLSNESVKFLGRYQGCLIPNFKDGNGINRSIDTILNGGMMTTGLFAFIDTEALEDYANKSDSDSTLDVIGHEVVQSLIDNSTPLEDIEFLSYKQNLTDEKTYTTATTAQTLEDVMVSLTNLSNVYVTSQYFGDDKGILNNQIKIKKPFSSNVAATTSYTELVGKLKSGKFVVHGYEGLSNSANVTYFSVTESYERNEKDENGVDSTYLYATVRNKNKKGEQDTAYTFQETNLASNIITLTGYSMYGARVGTDVYFQPLTTEYDGFYAKVKTITRDVANSKANITVSGTSASLSALSASNVNYKVVVSHYDPLYTIANATTYTWTMKYSDSPVYRANVVSGSYTAINSYSGTPEFSDYVSGTLANGDVTTSNKYVKYEKVEDTNGLPIVKMNFYTSNTLSTLNQTSSPANDSTFTVSTGAEDIYTVIDIISGSLATNQKSVKMTAVNAALLTTKDYLATRVLVEGEYKSYLTRILTKVKNSDGTFTITTSNDIYVSVNGLIEQVTMVKNIEDFATNYSFHNFEGFKLTSYHLPGNQSNKQTQLAKIIGVLEGTNLYKSLIDNNLIKFRYIVDTFDGGLAYNSYPKNILTRLAKYKQKCLAIINAPSIKDFKASTDPRFTVEPDPSNGNPKPTLEVRYIRDGGNLSLAPSSTYSLPTEEDGSKYAGFFINYPTIKESGKIFPVPPAAFISNLYVDKFKTGSQYELVAGVKRGTITVPNGTGKLEYAFNDDDRAYLAEIGLNPLVIKQGGMVIFDDNMAYQKTKSAFNNLSLRDLLITIEDGIEQILEGYMFDFNDDTTRSEIDKKVRTFLQGVQTNRGIYDFSVQIDTDNNTPEIIDQNKCILDVSIEPAKGIKVFINRVTIEKTGGLTQGGFA